MKKILLFLFLVAFTIACTSNADKAKTSAQISAAAIKTISLNVKGMSCSGCEETINESVQKITGVTECIASFKDGKANVKYDTTKTNLKAISKAITSAGYEVSGDQTVN